MSAIACVNGRGWRRRFGQKPRPTPVVRASTRRRVRSRPRPARRGGAAHDRRTVRPVGSRARLDHADQVGSPARPCPRREGNDLAQRSDEVGLPSAGTRSGHRRRRQHRLVSVSSARTRRADDEGSAPKNLAPKPCNASSGTAPAAARARCQSDAPKATSTPAGPRDAGSFVRQRATVVFDGPRHCCAFRGCAARSVDIATGSRLLKGMPGTFRSSACSAQGPKAIAVSFLVKSTGCPNAAKSPAAIELVPVNRLDRPSRPSDAAAVDPRGKRCRHRKLDEARIEADMPHLKVKARRRGRRVGQADKAWISLSISSRVSADSGSPSLSVSIRKML